MAFRPTAPIIVSGASARTRRAAGRARGAGRPRLTCPSVGARTPRWKPNAGITGSLAACRSPSRARLDFVAMPRPLRRCVIAITLAGRGPAAASGLAGPRYSPWYVNPDNGGQGRLAEKCTTGGERAAYRIELQMLPSTADAPRREQLVRRLAGRDRSIDLMSLDPPFVAEGFANAGFLRGDHPATRTSPRSPRDVLQAPRQTA